MLKKTLFHRQNFLTAPELLTILLLLGILAALLLSAGALKSRSEDQAVSTDRNQLRLLSHALFLYSDDHCSFLPPEHDAGGIRILQNGGYLTEQTMPRPDRAFLYYGGLLQIEFQQNMGMLRNSTGTHRGRGNTAFGDGHVRLFRDKDGQLWSAQDSFFQMDHRNSDSAIRSLNRPLLWSSTWLTR